MTITNTPARTAPSDHLTTAMVDQLRAALVADRSERVASLASSGAGFAERDIEESVAAGHRDALVEINQALARLDDGTYGSCTRCGAGIPFPRLEAVPQARTCVGCPESAHTDLFG